MNSSILWRSLRRIAVVAVPLAAVACASPSRLGMVKDPETGLQFGSTVEKNIVTDPSFFHNRKIKVRIRNTSGDVAFDLKGFKHQIEAAYAQAGYHPAEGDDFGLLVDVNVMYSGQVQNSLTKEFGFLGAAAGGLAGVSRGDAMAAVAGTVAGATLGSIIGSYVTDDTYIIVTRVTFGIVKGPPRSDGKKIVFSRSVAGTKEDEEEREERRSARGISDSQSSGVAVYAGGRNVVQAEIAGQVRERIVRIIRDII